MRIVQCFASACRRARVGGGLVLVAAALVFSGCGKDEDGSPTAPVDPAAQVVIEEFGDPQIQFDPTVGTTTLVVQFVARDGNREPLHADDLEVELQIDDRPIDVEGLLDEDSEALASSLHLTLVLDASYSMLQHSPSAFTPMLASARRTTAEGKSLYVERPGSFDWDLVWFADRIYRPLETTADAEWLETDIERIPAPEPGGFTKLYAAAKSAIESSATHSAATGATSRDQHLVVVFSDGADNYSWFDNSDLGGTGSIGTQRSYEWTGAAPVGKADVDALLEQHPEIQLHVMGLGSDVNDSELDALARQGRGRYFKNVDASNVDVLFEQVTQEFTSVQTRGATVPLPPGEYVFRVKARRTDTGTEGVHEFRFRGGQIGARVLD